VSKSFGTLEKAMEILRLFSSEQPELSAPEVAEKLEMPLSTVYKYLQVFHNKKFLSKDDRTSKFFPGLTILKLGLLAAKKISVMEIASPYLKALADRSLETAVLTVLDGRNAKGNMLPLYAGSPGKAVLAYKDPTFIDELIEATGLARLNKNTITESQRIKEELAAIRRQGFSESDSEFESEVCSVAAPIFDYKGQVIASIAVAGPAERVFRENKQNLINLVKECAQGISSELGHGDGSGKRPR
jgi:DNA-binding IclR family transcriptional regulator